MDLSDSSHIPDRDNSSGFTLDQVRSLWFTEGESPPEGVGLTIKREAPGGEEPDVSATESGIGQTSSRQASRRISMPGSSITLRSNRVVSVAGAAPTSLEPGDYELGQKIGQGGMGVIVAAKQASLDRRVAVKMIRGDKTDDESSRYKFILEALATGSLEHPNVVPIYELGQDEDGKLFYSMKEVKGANWRKVMAKHSEKENVETLCQVANAVASAHAKGILHRDIKSENVMLGDFGEVMLMDWGLAVGMRVGAKALPLRQENALAGTPAYMAPEMARGNVGEIGPWSDQYLLGALLFEILTGEAPHPGKTVEECLQNAANNVITECDRADEWMEVAARAMHGNPIKRYPSVKDFIAAVRNCQAHAESLELSRLAGEWLEKAVASGDYDGYNRAVTGYEQALELWDGNDAAGRDAQTARLAYAGTALSRGDYELCLSLLGKVDADRGGELLQKAEKGKRERDSRRRLVRILGTAAAILLIVAAVVAGGAAVLVSRQAKAERLARQEAENERKRAEDALVETERQRALAEEQRGLAETRQLEAESQRQRAENALSETERQRAIAERERGEAEEQRGLAVARQREAEKERRRAENALTETERQRAIAEERRLEALAALAAAEEARRNEAEAMAARLREERARSEAETAARQAAEEALEAREVVQRMGYLEDNSRWRMDADRAARRQREAEPDGSANPVVAGVDIEFVPIPAGEFVMGSPPREPNRSSEEYLHEVQLTRTFFLASRELTRGQWQTLIGVESTDDIQPRGREESAVAWRLAPVPPDEAELPASGISHREVEELLLPAVRDRLGPGYVVRLPTEAEWEWAARAGVTTAYSGGDGPEDLENEAWFDANSRGQPHRVGQKRPNVWGIYDICGNIGEMTMDHYDPSFYLQAPKRNPVSRVDTPMRVVRGGSFISLPRQCRLASRSYTHRENRHPQVGVRLAAQAASAAGGGSDAVADAP